MSLLAIDVGAGTQDILYYEEDLSLEGSTKMVLPSQTVLVGDRINRARLAGRDVFLRVAAIGVAIDLRHCSAQIYGGCHAGPGPLIEVEAEELPPRRF